MGDPPLVSVIVIFRDGERFLGEAIQSVLAQSRREWELILVDDGSADRSGFIAQGYAAADARIRYVTHPGGVNRGMSASRNLGIASSSGPFVAFLDGDDTWLPDKLEEQLQLMDEHPRASMIYGRTQWWYSWPGSDESQKRDYLYEPGIALDCLHEPPSLLQSLIRDDGNPPYTCSILLRRDALERVGGFVDAFTGLYEDQAFFAKIFLTEPVFVSSRCWDRYRQHDESACSVARATGELHPVDLSSSRHRFLEWLTDWITSQGTPDSETRDALERALRPYRFHTAPAWIDEVKIHVENSSMLRGGHLELPASGTRTRGGTLYLLGWVIGAKERVAELRVLQGAAITACAPVNKPRPDLMHAFPDHAPHAGFRLAIPLPRPGPFTLGLDAVLASGQSVPFATLKGHRILRGTDAGIGLPLVTIVIEADDPELLLGAVRAAAGQTYAAIEVVVATDGHAVAGSIGVAGTRIVDGGTANAVLGARGEAVVVTKASERLEPTAVADGLDALLIVPAADAAIGRSADGAELPGTVIYRKIALTAGSAPVATAGHDAIVARSVRRRSACRSVVLMYHRVAVMQSDPWQLAVTPANFREQIEMLCAEYDIVPAGAIRPDQPAGTRPRVALTFDDAYADCLEAARTLAACSVPATVFVATGAIDARREFWWDDLERIFLSSSQLPDTLELEVAGRLLRSDLSSDAANAPVATAAWRASDPPPTPRHEAYLEYYRELRHLDSPERDRLLGELRSWAGIEEAGRQEMLAVTTDQLYELSRCNGIEIGAHTVTHPTLAVLDKERQHAEIHQSRHALQNMLRREVTSFAYPYGSRGDYGSDTVEIVRAAGYQQAFAATGGALYPRAPLLELPRLMVMNWSGDELHAYLRADLVRDD